MSQGALYQRTALAIAARDEKLAAMKGAAYCEADFPIFEREMILRMRAPFERCLSIVR
ncbi:protein of unknown function [Bradyrhizobium vignae]|uniref:Uncharacterized protein n=1 Tax=Bradyrhizobium vignae TaxID=1549949 RepID=A0A2U3PWA7_9BRAD|nr:protein of unknown function [Bradyrhizobium vignae]